MTNYITEKDTFFLPQAKENLFMLDKGGVSQRIEADNVTYIFEVEDKKPSYIPELAEVKQQLLIDYKVDKITKEGIKALESDNGLDLIFLVKTDYLPKHKKLTLGGLIGFLKEEGFLGETVSEIDFLYDNTAIALAELYSEWRETGKLNYDDEDSNVWSAITNFSASATARKDLLRRLRSIKNQVPDEDGEREIVELWKESNNWESWDKHLDSLIELLQQE